VVFSSITFLFFFLPTTLILYFVVPKKYKNTILLLLSLLFYAWGEGIYIAFLLLSIVGNFFCAKKISQKGKVPLFFGVLFNILLLGVLKYALFFTETLNSVFHLHISSPHIHLPIGISFFTFQALSYIIDVYRKKIHVQKSITKLGLYISLFPQLIAGPIVRYSDIESEIDTRTINLQKVTEGAQRFIIGLSKKVLIANTLASTADLILDGNTDLLSSPIAWLGILCYTFQIYFDFSGYSDMAIGLGKMFGFSFPENFHYPYISTSIREFWQRWHISLSSWLKDYLYIPLGGNRKGMYRTYVNLIIVFLLCGLWHGAAWNFILWGGYYGIFLVLERIGFIQNFLKKIPKLFLHIYALLVVIIGWVFFRIESIPQAFLYIQHMFTFSEWNNFASQLQYYFTPKFSILFLCAILASTPIAQLVKRKYRMYFIQPILILLLLLCSLELASGSYNPFIYFRF